MLQSWELKESSESLSYDSVDDVLEDVWNIEDAEHLDEAKLDVKEIGGVFDLLKYLVARLENLLNFSLVLWHNENFVELL